MMTWFAGLSRYQRAVVALTVAGLLLLVAILVTTVATGETPWFLLAPTGGFLTYGLLNFPYPRQRGRDDAVA